MYLDQTSYPVFILLTDQQTKIIIMHNSRPHIVIRDHAYKRGKVEDLLIHLVIFSATYEENRM